MAAEAQAALASNTCNRMIKKKTTNRSVFPQILPPSERFLFFTQQEVPIDLFLDRTVAGVAASAAWASAAILAAHGSIADSTIHISEALVGHAPALFARAATSTSHAEVRAGSGATLLKRL